MVATPKTVDCAIPHEFQGISTDVTVAASSTLRLRSLRSSPLSSYSCLKRLLVRMMDIYWSPVVRLKKIPEHTVELTTLTVRCAMRKNICEMAESIPLPYITPPKHIAQMINQMVSIIPPIPLVATKSLSWAFPVSMAVSLVAHCIMAYIDDRLDDSGAISRII